MGQEQIIPVFTLQKLLRMYCGQIATVQCAEGRAGADTTLFPPSHFAAKHSESLLF